MTTIRSRSKLGAVARLPAHGMAVGLLAVGLLLGSAPLTAGRTGAAEPRVVIIVGPTGSVTDDYRADGALAADEARRYTSQVVTVFSPDATWPAARAAMQGASIVVYIGHGNGWPSPYSSSLVPATQDGLGLNPVAGVDDAAHQYFGEAYLASSVHLAPHAVVLLFHLCYASGESEPGLPPAPLDVAEQRVDNYAAGWMRAGAEAVISDSSSAAVPYFMAAILSATGSIEDIWRASPTFNGHVIGTSSIRTPPMVSLLDPVEPATGFYRSFVGRATLQAADVARAADAEQRWMDGTAIAPAAPTGPVVDGLTLADPPVGGSTVPLVVTSSSPGATPIGLGIRWDVLALDPTGAPPAAAPPAAGGAPPIPRSPVPSTSPPPPTASPKPTTSGAVSSGDPVAAAAVTPATTGAAVLVRPEVPGDVVSIAETRVAATGFEATIPVPTAPGLYRLVVTLHDGDGIAFDRATQERVPALIVHVAPPVAAWIGAPPSLALVAGASVDVPLVVTNTGEAAWVSPPVRSGPDGPDVPAPAAAMVVGHWIRLDVGGGAVPPPAVGTAVTPEPGTTVDVDLRITAPEAIGDYLLVLDVVTPLYGSLAARGVSPVAIPVRVDPVLASPAADPTR